jgi:hypothetical protein
MGLLSHTNRTEIPVIIDSGLDITLISDKLYRSLKPVPKKLTGRKVNLIQVTGSALINEYVKVPLVFETKEGPVKMEVEVYVVKVCQRRSY